MPDDQIRNNASPLTDPAVVYALAQRDAAFCEQRVALLETQGQLLNVLGPQAVDALKAAQAALAQAKAALPTVDAKAIQVEP